MTTDTVELHYVLEGPEDAPVLVLSNSLGTTLDMWNEQVAALREKFRLLRYDHRGHGGSSVSPGPYLVKALGGDLLALLDALGIKRFSLCGLSIGGLVGMWLASEVPQRVESLVLCCTSARFEPADAFDARAKTVRAEGVGAIADAVVERWFTPRFRALHPEIVEWGGSMLRNTPAEGYAGCCEVVRDADLRGRLGAITAPTLVIAGADDPAAPVNQAEIMRDSIPNARLLAVEEAAHLANVEQPEEVTRAILEHLEAADGRRNAG